MRIKRHLGSKFVFKESIEDNQMPFARRDNPSLIGPATGMGVQEDDT